MFVFAVKAKAVDFNTLLSEQLWNEGVYNGKNGIFYADLLENETALAVFSANDMVITITIYGTDCEIVDEMTVPLGGKNRYLISVSDTDSFGMSITTNKKTENFVLVNDSIELSGKTDNNYIQLVEYKRGNMNVIVNHDYVYSLANEMKYRKIEQIPLKQIQIDNPDSLMSILAAASGIGKYKTEDGPDYLTYRILMAHDCFAHVTDISPQTANADNSLMMCSADYIASAAQKVFRTDTPKPAINMLSELGYCYNNNFYYYKGKYTKSFSTTITGIEKAYEYIDNSYYIVFSDTYYEDEKQSFPEYSSAVVKYDNDGYYIHSIEMGSGLDDAFISVSPTDSPTISVKLDFIPIVIMILAVAVIGVVIWVFIL